MANVNVTRSIQVPASRVWEKLSSFRGIEDYSPIARSVTEGEGAGAKRTCYMPDDAAIHETLVAVDNDSMQFQYRIDEGPFPVEGYFSTVTVKPTGENDTEVTWGCEFNSAPEHEEDMKNLFAGFYNVIIESLESVIQNEN